MLDWFKNNLVASYMSKASRAMPNTVSTWQETNATHSMESYFSHIEEAFGQSIYDLLVQKFLSVSKAYLDSFNLSEWHIYGSSRIGIYQTSKTLVSLKFYADTSAYGLTNPQPVQIYYATTSYDFFYLERGKRHYELSNHLGNVLTVVSDKRILICNADTVTTSIASIISATDYSPFGAPLPERTFSSEAYRFTFNGKEKLDEINGSGNAMDFGARIYDARLGRWMSVDPRVDKYPGYTPYCAFGNNPIIFVDPGGDTLKIAGDIEQATKDIMSLIPTEYHKRVQISSNGIVSIDLTAASGNAIPMIGPNEYSDAGLQLLVNLVTAKENYTYMASSDGKYECKVWNGAAKNAITGKKQYQTQIRDLVSDNGVENISTTKRYASVIGNPIQGLSPIIPSDGSDGMVVVLKNAKFKDASGNDVRANIIFHELWENYERTTNLQPYRMPVYKKDGYVLMQTKNWLEPVWDKNSNGAHEKAINAEKRFYKKSSSPGKANYFKN